MTSKTLRARVALIELEAMGLTLDDLLEVTGREVANRPTGPTIADYVPVVAEGFQPRSQTGAPSGLVVIDVDPTHGGDDTLKKIEEKHGAFPPGRTVRTGSGGMHLYFQHPGHKMANTAGRLGPGIDTRADGGYVLAPPSRHRTGGVYVVAGHGMQIPEMPIWLLQALEPPPPRTMPERSAPKDVGAWAKAAVTGELDRLGHAKEGSRNDTLNRVAYRLGQIIGSGALAEHEIEPMLIERGIALGLREREVVKTVRSGMQAGEGSPRGPTARSSPEPEL